MKPRGIWLAVVLLIAVSVSRGQDERIPTGYLAEKLTAGLKVKLADNFTMGTWAAFFWGTQYYPNRFRQEPGIFQGFDITPGFEAAVGTLFGRTRFSVGGDVFYSFRGYSYDGEPDVVRLRPRANLIFTTPFAGGFTLQLVNRFERTFERKYFASETGQLLGIGLWDYMCFRSMLKVATPPFTRFKITPYAYYDAFVAQNNSYYFEVEAGASASLVKGLNVTLAYQFQSQPVRPNYATHQPSLYVFYTFDLSDRIASRVERAAGKRSGEASQ